MNSDAYYEIGSGHTVCQDYARAGVTRPGPGLASPRCFALLADGCSSSAHSDLGARLLVCTAIRSLELFGDLMSTDWLLSRAALAADELSIDRGCLDATLLAAWEADDGQIEIRVAGDGVVAAKRCDGRIEIWTVDYGGAPAYLSYGLVEGRKRQYLHEGYGLRTVTHRFEGKERVLEAATEMGAWRMTIDPRDYEFILLLSDGVESFECAAPMSSFSAERGPTIDAVLGQLLAIRSTRGEFMVRRSRRFLQRFCRENQWQHSDDLAVAGIYLGGSS